MKDLELEVLEFEMVEKFLEIIKKKFEGGDKESRKIMELKELEQDSKIIEEYIQEFKRAVRRSGYIGRSLVEKFKRGMKREIR